MTETSIPHLRGIVKGIEAGGLSPDREDRAPQGCDLSARSGPSGVSSPAFFVPGKSVARCNIPDGSKAVNPPTTILSPKTADTGNLDSVDKSYPRRVGLFKQYTNSDTQVIVGILDDFREYCYKLEHTPYAFLHLRHKMDGSAALYRVNACSSSRYFPEGRVQKVKEISQRLDGSGMQGVFFTLTVDAEQYSLTDAWPSMWRNFNRFKDALNMYRRRHMNASHGVLYLAALEPHRSHYPHLHVYCPGLHWLVKRQDLPRMDDWWGMGSVNTKKERHQDSARSYTLKYVAKMAAWSEVSLAMIWKFRIRVYNLSHRFRTGETEGEWELLGRYTDAEGLSEGLGIGFRDAEALIENWGEVDDNLVYLT
jgi:hypothetical protein